MIKNIEEQKAKLKERINSAIDEYCEKLNTSSSEPDFDINVLERIMVENRGNIRRAFSELTSEMADDLELGVKKTAQIVDTP
jgi:hypothetical protein